MAFGGIKIILVGSFWQLKPLPNVIDPGIPVHESYLFNTVFPHRYEPTEVLRQGETQILLKDALDEIRMGKRQDETEAYLTLLSCECPAMDKDKSIYTGNTKLLDNTIYQIISLKPGCRVILVYNINAKLNNGYHGQLVCRCSTLK